MYLEDSFKEVKERYRTACSKEITDEHYVGDVWFWSPNEGRYLCSKDNPTLKRFISNSSRKYFPTKRAAREYKYAKEELHRLTSIYVSKAIDDALDDIEKIVPGISDQWREDMWFSQDWY